MKQTFLHRCMVFLLTILLFHPTPVFANDSLNTTKNYLNIATFDSTPLYLDKLVYMALKDINYQLSLTNTTVQNGLTLTNSGVIDGVISYYPHLEQSYDHIIKVPVDLEQTNIMAVVRNGSGLEIKSGQDLSGLRFGVLPQRPYISSRIPEGATVIDIDTDALLLDALKQDNVDVVIMVQCLHETNKLPVDSITATPLESLTEYLYLSDSNAFLIPLITEALQNLYDDGRADMIIQDQFIPEINQKSTILHIVSSSTTVTREEQFYTTLRNHFDDDMSTEWYTLSLNSRHFFNPSRLAYIANLLRQDCVSRNVSAIVVSGDDALTFLAEYYHLFFKNTPVLFYGVNDRYPAIIEEYSQNCTGIVETLPAFETVEAALTLFPDTKNLYVVNDYATEGSQYRNIIETQLEPFSDRIHIRYNDNLDIDSLLQEIKNLPQDSLVLFGTYFCDASGQFYSQNEMKRLLEKECSVPIFSFHSTKVEYNAIGGKSMDFEEYGKAVIVMLQQMLDGVPVGDIPVITDSSSYNRWVFDQTKMNAFGIKESSLPPGSEVLNKPPSIWESNPRFVIALILLVVISIAIVITTSIIIIQRRKHREQRIHDAKIREVKERLERIISTAPISFIMCVDDTIVEANENAKIDTGLDIGDSVKPACVNPSDLALLYNRVIQESFIKNEIIRLYFTNGEIHRCLVNIAITDYEGVPAFAIWVISIEQTEQKKDQLQIAQQSLQSIIDTMPIPVSIFEKEPMKLVYGNNIYLKMLGFSSLEDLRKEISIDRLIVNISDEISPDKTVRLLIHSPDPLTKEITIRAINDKEIDVRIHTMPIDYNSNESTLCMLTDLAKEKEAQKMRQNLQTVLDILPVPVRIIKLKDDTIVYANNAAAELFGLANPELAFGLSSHHFTSSTQTNNVDVSELRKHLLRSQEPTAVEIVCRKASGEMFDTLITACLIEYDGMKASLGIIKDLTTEKEFQRMLRDTAEKEREANQLKSRFLVNMSHEIRTPMNAIIGLTDIELRSNPPTQVRSIYKKINTSAKNLLEIINDILDISKIEADKIEFYNDEFELEDVLNSALLVASPRLDEKNVEFMLNQALDLPRFIVGDKTRLWQILKNFLDNSAKYTDVGKIVMTVFADKEQSDDDTITITFIIEDTGIGIGDDQIKRIFMPYEQIYNNAQKKYSGTGLGMAISKQLCELMGGRLQVESRLGTGTTIHMSIPFKRSTNIETELQSIKSSALVGMDVLAVDDDNLSLDIMRRLLNSSDVKCTTARSGIEAMEIILERRDKGESFDIILLDYMMDGMTGLETAKQIHLALSKAPKLLMVTAYQKLLLKSELEKNGIDDVIEKPFIPSHFLHKLCTSLGLEIDMPDEALEVFTRFKDVHVLLCEDYRLNQEVATGMFAQYGITATIAEDGQQGVDILNSGKKFDLIFMDLQMPVMDGYEATRVIRADPRFDHIPIISLTADAMKEIADKCLEIGMNDYIAKPIEFDSLQRVFLKWLPEDKREQDTGGKKPVALPKNEALARFGGDKDRYQHALLEFTELLPDIWPDFEIAVQNNEQTARDIHKLKGAAGNLSENDIYQSATEFESSLRASQPDESLYKRLINVCTLVKKRILEDARNTNTVPKQTGTIEEFSEYLRGLEEALQDYDPKTSAGIINSLMEKNWPGTDESKLRRLYELTRRYEFDDALDALNEMMGDRNE